MPVNKRQFGVVLAAVLFTAGHPGAARADSISDNITILQEQVKTLADEQAQLLTQLTQLRHLVLEKNAGIQMGPLPISTVDTHGLPVQGNPAATVAIVEFSDFQCPYCEHYTTDTYSKLLADYVKTGKVRYFYRALPLVNHPQSISAAVAAQCAGDQGKFWDMHDSLFADPNHLESTDLTDRAQKLGLDLDKFNQCTADSKTADDFRAQSASLLTSGFRGTPTFLIGSIGNDGIIKVDTLIPGALPYDAFKLVLNTDLGIEP
ncbi:MAG: DsbA family protein [Capsulimonadaceae bacterium]